LAPSRHNAFAFSCQVKSAPGSLRFTDPNMKLTPLKINIRFAQGDDLFRSHPLVPDEPSQIAKIPIFRCSFEILAFLFS
jgi:hypothetical protein